MLEDHLSQALLYDSGELAPAEAAEFREHLSSCAQCRERLELVRGARELAKAVPVDAPPHLLAAVLASHGGGSSAKAAVRSGNSIGNWLRPAAALACAAAVFVMFRPAPPSDGDLSSRFLRLEERRMELETQNPDAQLSRKFFMLEQRRAAFEKELRTQKAKAGASRPGSEAP